MLCEINQKEKKPASSCLHMECKKVEYIRAEQKGSYQGEGSKVNGKLLFKVNKVAVLQDE